MGFIVGGFSFAAYAIALYAMTQAPIVLVGALRESSVFFAVFIGVLFLNEKLDVIKALGVGSILIGMVLLKI